MSSTKFEGNADDPLANLLHSADCAPEDVMAVAQSVVALGEDRLTETPAVALADSVIVLARTRNALDAEIARRLRAAENADTLRHTAHTTLEHEARWAGGTSHAMVAASRFAERHPAIARLWHGGCVPLESVAILARGTRALPESDAVQVVNALLPTLPQLSTRHLRIAVSRAVDLLMPEDRNQREQIAHDRRFIAFSDLNGVTSFHGELPSVDGCALRAALAALGESLRVEGDGLTKGQRSADALITMVNAAAAHGDLPASASGLPVATTITIGVAEADRIASHQRPTSRALADAVGASGRPGGLALNSDTSRTLGDAAVRFALCHGTLTGALVDDRTEGPGPVSQALSTTRLQPLALGRQTRLATSAQRIALALRDGGCVVSGRAAAECQTHHVVPWGEGGGTDLANLALVCWVHHRQVDLNRWHLERSPDPSPGNPHWLVTPTPRHRWRTR